MNKDSYEEIDNRSFCHVADIQFIGSAVYIGGLHHMGHDHQGAGRDHQKHGRDGTFHLIILSREMLFQWAGGGKRPLSGHTVLRKGCRERPDGVALLPGFLL